MPPVPVRLSIVAVWEASENVTVPLLSDRLLIASGVVEEPDSDEVAVAVLATIQVPPLDRERLSLKLKFS